jgi:hypothetical protein
MNKLHLFQAFTELVGPSSSIYLGTTCGSPTRNSCTLRFWVWALGVMATVWRSSAISMNWICHESVSVSLAVIGISSNRGLCSHGKQDDTLLSTLRRERSAARRINRNPRPKTIRPQNIQHDGVSRRKIAALILQNPDPWHNFLRLSAPDGHQVLAAGSEIQFSTL